MNNKAHIIAWGSDYLISQGHKIEHPPITVVETPWSIVFRFSTSKSCFYLKRTPTDLLIEIEVIEAIQKNMPNSLTPTILSINRDLNCFLMNSCGDTSLRTKFNGTIDPALLIRGLNSYIEILRSFEKSIDPLKVIKIPDWRIHHLPRLYVDLLEKRDLLLDEGLTGDELDKLHGLTHVIKSICEFLSAQKVKETLVNADFNENNMIMKEDTQQISIIDWGESVIAHPFFSIAAHLLSSARRYKLDLKGQLLEGIRQKCLSCWLDVANLKELETIYENILRLLPIFSSLAIFRLQASTQNKSKEMQNWFVAGALRTLLNNERCNK